MEPLENNPSRWAGLQTRIISAVALAALALICVWQGGVIFIALVMLTTLLAMKEWEKLTEYQMLILRLIGYPYVILPGVCLIWLRGLSVPLDTTLGFTVILALIAIVTATDTGAYFTGKQIGRHKLARVISPNKTWEGLAGGLCAASFVGLLFSPYIHVPHSLFSVVFIAFFLGLLAQAGDLFKSWVKRLAGVKDSGTLIPGHGGVLDRIDGYMFTAPILALIVHCAL